VKLKSQPEILILGGGLAGLTSAIHLATFGYSITLIEKKAYPHHKVCGEYISNEIKPYLSDLGIDLKHFEVPQIKRLQVSTVAGKVLNSKLPLGGFGISRYVLDHALYQKAIELGVNCIQDTVNSVQFSENEFQVTTSNGKELNSRIAIGAFGKRSTIDKSLKREFISQKAPWLGVKGHYKLPFPDDLIALHNFSGGYCGISKVEGGTVNACYLAQYSSFKKYNGLEEYQEKVLCKNPLLNEFFKTAEPVFEKPLSIAQISFARKKPIEQHMIMCGDTAGLIHPLCGNGMAMAIHSAKLAAELIHSHHRASPFDREGLERAYQHQWHKLFSKRLRAGRWIQNLFLSPKAGSFIMNSLQLFPGLVPSIVKQTHGSPKLVKSVL